jgi:hypothetical protein
MEALKNFVRNALGNPLTTAIGVLMGLMTTFMWGTGKIDGVTAGGLYTTAAGFVAAKDSTQKDFNQPPQ